MGMRQNGNADGGNTGNNTNTGGQGASGQADPLFDTASGQNTGGAGNGGGNGGANGGANTTGTGGGGAAAVNIPENWKEVLAPEVRDAGFLKNIKDIPTLVKTLENAQKMIGADKIAIPGQGSTQDDWKNVFRKLGLPEKPEDYKVEVDAKFQDKIDKDFMGEFSKAAHAAGILPSQAKQVAEWFSEANEKAFQAQEQAIQQLVDKQISDLKTEWGGAYEQNVTQAKAGMTEIMTPAEQELIRKSGLGRNPLFIKAMQRVGAMVAEDKTTTGNEGDERVRVLDPSGARAEINTLKAKGSPYWDPSHENHGKVKARVRELYKQAFPEQKMA